MHSGMCNVTCIKGKNILRSPIVGMQLDRRGMLQIRGTGWVIWVKSVGQRTWGLRTTRKVGRETCRRMSGRRDALESFL